MCEATLVKNSTNNMMSVPGRSSLRSPGVLEADVIEFTASENLHGLGNVAEINIQVDEYAAGKGYPQLAIQP